MQAIATTEDRKVEDRKVDGPLKYRQIYQEAASASWPARLLTVVQISQILMSQIYSPTSHVRISCSFFSLVSHSSAFSFGPVFSVML